MADSGVYRGLDFELYSLFSVILFSELLCEVHVRLSNTWYADQSGPSSLPHLLNSTPLLSHDSLTNKSNTVQTIKPKFRRTVFLVVARYRSSLVSTEYKSLSILHLIVAVPPAIRCNQHLHPTNSSPAHRPANDSGTTL
jgi:hypothetical protein